MSDFDLRPDPKNREVEVLIRNHKLITRRGIRMAYFRIGSDLVKEARRLILEGPKTGRIYIIKGVRHQASAPGEAPANLTGLLRRSIAYQQRSGGQMAFGARTEYAPWLELGTRDGRIAPRPYLIKAINNLQKNSREHLEREIKLAHRRRI